MAEALVATRTRPRRPVDKYDARRDELAMSALATLGDRGYANTSLRDIAQNSDFSHGVLHYYFADKTELIIHGVRLYKATCVTRYDEVVSHSRTALDLVDRFSAKLVETLEQDASMHTLWYDLRNQAMFEPDFREAVQTIDQTLEQMIWRVVERFAQLSERPVAVSPAMAYGLMDGLFEQAVRGHVNGDRDASTNLAERAAAVLPLYLG